MSQQHEKPSLAHGSPLSRDSWSDFVGRLRHDCVGEGVRNHHTADAIFKVEARKIVYGIDRDYTDKQAVICDDSTWFSPQEYWDDLDEEEQAQLNKIAQHWHECDFLELDESDQWDQLDDIDDHRVVGWEEEWEYVNSHFTKDAAEAFIERKRHDYRKGIRVYVDAQTHCWEYNTIKEAILQGRIGLTDELQRVKEEQAALIEFIKETADVLDELSSEILISRLKGGAAGAASGLRKAVASLSGALGVESAA
ncbi:hypothetical protein OB952_07790 [Aeromonas salmonicida]|uniref:hypothetical protein n=1 Tax=Aeromonas salmonicida TaxID=645 RepID=UPI00259F21B2|nr:hypothetical protein [Aeromonas salmonicida]MDM5067266.1 hypothetical protein [Aeromonas salmonicida]